jgi:hypothetical protein
MDFVAIIKYSQVVGGDAIHHERVMQIPKDIYIDEIWRCVCMTLGMDGKMMQPDSVQIKPLKIFDE